MSVVMNTEIGKILGKDNELEPNEIALAQYNPENDNKLQQSTEGAV